MEAAITQVEVRYRALNTIATILRVLAWVVLILGAIGIAIAVIGTATLDDGGGAGSAIAVLIGGPIYLGIVVIGLFAYSELIKLMINLEENTRVTARALLERP